jgi:membrane peptidoglycan carboxypeptidase
VGALATQSSYRLDPPLTQPPPGPDPFTTRLDGNVTKLLRLVALVAAGALLLTGTIVSLSSLGDHLFHNAASAQEMPLPALASTLLEGSTVYADDGHTVLAVLQASQYRKPVGLNQVSKTAIKAVLDTEDHRFYLHGGFDIPSTVRALAADSSGSGIQGGSTITQQLVKQLYLTSQRTVSRKIKEAVIADRLAREYTKDQILQAYLNTIYLGNGAYGIEAAANVYFGEHASQLNLAQSALLAGLIQNPSGYDPIANPIGARDRRAEVLARMVHYGDISETQATAADAVALPTAVVAPAVSGDEITDYYVQQVVTQLLGTGSPLGSTYQERYAALFEGGLKIYTNLDPGLQALAEQTIANDTPANNRGFQEAMVTIDPTTGKVRAMVGGTGFSQAAGSHFNIITEGNRQPGSGFKIFTLLAALEQGYSIYDTVDGESPCAVKFPGDNDLVSHPINNDEGNGGGILTLLNATAQSTNCAYVRLAHEVGLPNVANMARALGITTNLAIGPGVYPPSMVIGAVAVPPIEMAAAYATVADNGVYHTPTFIDHIVDRTGATIYSGAAPGRRVIPAWVAAEATVAFQAVVQHGTGTAAEIYNRPVAGKTGTTSSSVDAWFNGFTPQLETTVWMGNLAAEVPMFDVGGVGEVYGGTFPTITWHAFMAAALANQPVLAFAPLDTALLPRAHYITSPSLVADDVLNHNFGGYANPSNGNGPPTSTGSPAPTTPAPSSPPVGASNPPPTVPTSLPAGRRHKPPPTT